MRLIKSNQGFALITALMFTLMSLVITMALMYTITQNIQRSGTQKMYRNSVEAAYGGMDVVLTNLIPLLYVNTDPNTVTQRGFPSLTNLYLLGSDNTGTKGDKCIREKLTQAPAGWVDCDSLAQNLDPKKVPDVTFTLKGTTGQQFTVYSKIVDTIPGPPYIDAMGTALVGGGVVDTGGAGSGISTKHTVYRLEVEAARAANTEKGALTVLYEY